MELDPAGYADPSTFPQELLDEHGMLKSPAQYTPLPLRVPEMEPQMTVPEVMPQVLPLAGTPKPVRADARMSGPDRDTFHIFRIPSDETGAHDIFSFRME